MSHEDLFFLLSSWDTHSWGKMLFTAKINPDAFVLFPDKFHVLCQSTTCGMNDTHCAELLVMLYLPVSLQLNPLYLVISLVSFEG